MKRKIVGICPTVFPYKNLYDAPFRRNPMDKIIIGLIFLCALVYLIRRFTKSVRGGGCGCDCGDCCASGNKKAGCHEKKD